MPTGIAVDSEGNAYVAEQDTDTVQKFSTSSGALLLTFGGHGSATGQLDTPFDVAVDSAGSVFVADTRNDRVQAFSASGAFAGVLGGTGTGPGQLVRPAGVAAGPAGTVYVSDSGNRRVQRLARSGGFIESFRLPAAPSGGSSPAPAGIAVDPAGSVYVVDGNNNRVLKFTVSGEVIQGWPIISGLGPIEGVTTDRAGNLYVVRSVADRVAKFSPGGRALTEFGVGGAGDPGIPATGQFRQPWDAATDSACNVYVTNSLYVPKVLRFGDPAGSRCADTTRPSVSISPEPRLTKRAIALRISCRSEDCTVSASAVGRLGAGSSSRSLRAEAPPSQLRKGRPAILRLTFSKSARRAIGRALEGGRHVRIKATAEVTDGAGNTRTATRTTGPR